MVYFGADRRVTIAVFTILSLFAANSARASSGSTSLSACAPGFASLSRPDPATGPRNPQLAIWTLEARGKTTAADELRKQSTEALRTAKILNYDEVPGSDATSLTFLELEGGLRGVWKTADYEEEYTTLRQIKKEVTAYKFDQMIGAGLVPITVPRTFRGRPGVVQLFVRDVDATDLTYSPSTLKLFDFLIAHVDRNHLNHLTHRGRTIAIDNESSFSADSLNPVIPQFDKFIFEVLKKVETAGSTVTAKNSAIAEIAPTLIGKDVVEKLRTTTDAQWKKGLTGLDKNELAAFIERKNRALKAIDLAIEKLGPDIFPAPRFSGLSRNQWGPETQFLRSAAAQLPRGALKDEALRAQSLLEGHAVSGRPITPEQIDFIDRTLTEIEKFQAGAQRENK